MLARFLSADDASLPTDRQIPQTVRTNYSTPSGTLFKMRLTFSQMRLTYLEREATFAPTASRI